MTKRNIGLALTLATCAALSLAACGGDGKKKGDSSGGDAGAAGAGGSGGTAGGINIGGAAGNPTHNGGTQDLTPEQVQALLSGSCADWAATGENLPAALELVVDVSQSMSQDAPGSNQSKWEVTRDALLSALEGLADNVAVGVLMYPNMSVNSGSTPQDTSECVNVDRMVDIAPLGAAASAQRTLVSDAISNANVRSYTPTHDAYSYALENGLLPYDADVNRFMLVITDGAPTLSLGCVNPGGGNGVADAPTQPIIDAISAAYDDDAVRTFIIGSPGSEESSTQGGDDMRPWLSAAAVAGHTSAEGCEVDGPNFCHMDMTQEPDFAAALQEGLAEVTGQLIDACTFAFPTAPAGQTIDPTKTNVIVTWKDGTSTLMLPDENGTCTEGWVINTSNQVELCGESCDQVKADRAAKVDLAFGCESGVIPIIR